MAVNHVIINGETVVDLRNDTVSADKLLKGVTAHDKTGVKITGTMPISASGALIVHVTDNNGTLSKDKTYIEIRDAILAGTPVLVAYDGNGLPLIGIADSLFFGTTMCDETSVGTVIIEITSNGEVNDVSAIVETLPNPNAITFTGAVTGSYDGTAPMTVKIPSAVTDAHINSLIDTKLGVIENGSY